MSNMQGLILFQKHYDLMLYAIPIINRFPASQRYVLGQQIQNCMLEIAGLIVRANKSQQYRKARIFDIDTELEKLRLLLRLAKDLGHAKHADTWHIRRQVLGETVFSRPSPETGR